MMTLGVPKESNLVGAAATETRTPISVDTVKKYVKLGVQVRVEKGCGEKAFISDEDLKQAGAQVVSDHSAWECDIVLSIGRPSKEGVALMKPNSLLVGLLEPYGDSKWFEDLALKKINSLALEWVPRTSRAQSMDVLSSQANIAGYRAVLEGAHRYPRFFPMMMTSAGSAKPAKVMVLGAGVAGLQAIGTAKRLGSQVEAYDIRPEVKEQILSLGAKFIDLSISEQGSGSGGYAKELSAEGKLEQQKLLGAYLKKADLIISTAAIPGRKAPVLITEDTVKGMRPGSVIVDLAASTGGNCALTEPGSVIQKHGVFLVGILSYPQLVPYDSSQFFAKNIYHLLSLMLNQKDASLSYPLSDDIVDATLVTYEGQVRKKI